MHIFSIYQSNKDLDNVVIVKSGISLVAAIFNIFWAIYNSIWFIVLPIFLLSFALGYFQLTSAQNLLHTLWFFVFLLFSEEMLKWNLKIKKYELVDVIYARSKESAEYKFLKRKMHNA